MKRMLFLLVFLLTSVTYLVYAEEDTTCNYSSKAALNKLSSNVTAAYDLKTDEAGNNYFEIAFYNIVKELYIEYLDTTNSEDAGTVVVNQETDNGTFKFRVDDINNIIKYRIDVYANEYGCNGKLRSLTITKPKKNPMFDYDVCKQPKAHDVAYCNEWITVDYKLTNRQMEEKIEQELKRRVENTTECVDCKDVKNNGSEKKKTVKERIKIVIIILIVIAAFDLLYIVIKTILLKRSEL